MRLLSLIFVLGLVGCNTAQEQPVTDQPVKGQPVPQIDISVDLGYITVFQASMEGVFLDQSIDRVTLIDGASDMEETRIELISESEDELIVMGLNYFFGDVGADDYTSVTLGCAGEELFEWDYDVRPNSSTVDITQELDIYIVRFALEFDNDEWLHGNYTYALN